MSARSSLTRWITRSAASVSTKVITTMDARDRPAAISVSRLAASPNTTVSPAAAASRTRSGSRSSAMKEMPSFSRNRPRY
jgi:hypothetical protein